VLNNIGVVCSKRHIVGYDVLIRMANVDQVDVFL